MCGGKCNNKPPHLWRKLNKPADPLWLNVFQPYSGSINYRVEITSPDMHRACKSVCEESRATSRQQEASDAG